MDIWGELYRAVAVAPWPITSYVPKPTIPMLDQFQRLFGVPIPDEYRDFSRVFGPGELRLYGGDGGAILAIRFLTPGCDDSGYDMTGRNSELREMMVEYEGGVSGSPHADPQLMRRLLLFAETFTGDCFCWDSSQSNDTDQPVHYWGRGDYNTSVIASSVKLFLDAIWHGDGYSPLLLGSEGTRIQSRRFFPLMRDPGPDG